MITIRVAAHSAAEKAINSPDNRTTSFAHQEAKSAFSSLALFRTVQKRKHALLVKWGNVHHSATLANYKGLGKQLRRLWFCNSASR